MGVLLDVGFNREANFGAEPAMVGARDRGQPVERGAGKPHRELARRFERHGATVLLS